MGTDARIIKTSSRTMDTGSNNRKEQRIFVDDNENVISSNTSDIFGL